VEGPSDSKWLQEVSTGLFNPWQGVTIDNEASGIHGVIHSNSSNASHTLAAETKNFAPLVLHDSGVCAVSATNALLTVREVAAILRVCEACSICGSWIGPGLALLSALSWELREAASRVTSHRRSRCKMDSLRPSAR